MSPLNGNGRKRLVCDINVTPLVDVMLVLLIIFMVTAPMMTQGLDVDLPQTTTKALRQEENPIVITIDKDEKISLGEFTVTRKLLYQQLQKYDKEKKGKPIYLKADKSVSYGVVAAVMADLKNAGFEKLGMITQPEAEKR